jgi:hypothetical protein
VNGLKARSHDGNLEKAKTTGEKIMKASNTHVPNSGDAWLLATMVVTSFGVLLTVGFSWFGLFSKAQATNALPPPDPALTGNFGRMFRNLPPFAPPTDAVRDALMQLGSPGGIMDANDNLAAGPVALITDPNLQLINRNNPTHTAGIIPDAAYHFTKRSHLLL